jgi:signal transduction histidine kinase
LPTESAIIVGDEARIERVLINLLGNAHKYGPDGGEILVRLSINDGRACVIVEDQGPGIPEDEAQRVFERFYRSNDPDTQRHQGSGLGLAIARALVELHGGSIGVKSPAGSGAQFWVSLPLVGEEMPGQEAGG